MSRRKFLIFLALVLATPVLFGGIASGAANFTLGMTPDYFGTIPNYANSPTTIHKFVNTLPGLGSAGVNDLGQYLPVAVADTTTYPGSDYYEIALVRYSEKMHTDLPATALRGYVQISTAVVPGSNIALTYPGGAPIMHNGLQVHAVDNPHYMGPTIVATKDRPVRVKFTNYLPTGAAGNLPIPVDTTMMGAGLGPDGVNSYTQNRTAMHLHGGATPWISDGTPHQWTTPAGEAPYTRGDSVQFVPDMWFDATGNTIASCAGNTTCGVAGATNDPGAGSLTFYYTNQQSSRLMFYHDHAVGITRLNVYAGVASGYVLTDPVETALINGLAIGTTGVVAAAGTIPAVQIPLIIQDKTFVDPTTIGAQDPTWAWGSNPAVGVAPGVPTAGDLWIPHVYMTNQHPTASTGVNDMGRWDYNTWMYPPITTQIIGPAPNPLAGVIPCAGCPAEPPVIPGTPQPTIVPEGFMDTPLVNGTAYPILHVRPQAYRFRILNAANDRTFNLQLHYAATAAGVVCRNGAAPAAQCTEVNMVPAVTTAGFPATWPTDGRDGGVPDPANVGPNMIQIGNEGGFLAAPVVIPNQPVSYEYSRRVIFALNIKDRALLMVPAERADVIIDFSAVPNNSVIMLYNDSPAPAPGFDPRYDYFTGAPDQTAGGGAPTPAAGFGPNTRTIMQIRVDATGIPGSAPVAIAPATWQAAYRTAQDPPIVPQAAYGPAFGTIFPDQFLHVSDPNLTFVPFGGTTAVSYGTQDKAIIENWDMMYGRMNALLGGALPNLGPQAGVATPFSYFNPPTEVMNYGGIQIWRLDHQGVDLHSMHFHQFNVQVINRVALDGTLFPPQPNELGWNESVQAPPALDTIIAIRPKALTLPWPVPNSVRALDPSTPLGTPLIDSGGVTVINAMQNFGHEYVWHCHLLGHEENDMMRPLVFSPNGVAEILWRNTATGENAIWYVDGTTVLSFASLPIVPLAWSIEGRGDFNGDGIPDILWRNTTTGEVAVWYMNGATVTGFASLPSSGPNWTIVGTGDFNGDGKADILWRNTTDGQTAIWYMNGVTVTGVASLPITPTVWTIVGVRDFNNDGKPDILWHNTSTSANAIWYMDGITVTGVDNVAAVPANTAIVGTGDFNADINTDLLMRNTVTGDVGVQFMTGATFAGVGSIGNAPLNWKIVGQ